MRATLASIALLAASTGVAAPPASDPKDAIEYREHVMKALDEQTAALGMILSGAIPDDNVGAHIDALAVTASVALKAFEPKVPGGEAKPEVWANWADFSKRMKDFQQKTAAMAKLSKEQGTAAALDHVLDALSCKGCHDTYRQERHR